MGAHYADRTSARTFQIRPKGTTKLRDAAELSREAKFRSKKPRSKIGGNPTWIEKSKYLIDTRGEREGITVKGLLAIKAGRRRRRGSKK